VWPIFLIPCAAVAALVFRRSESWLMIMLTLLPRVVWNRLGDNTRPQLCPCSGDAASRLFTLNVVSIGVLICLLGWFQVDIYRRLEKNWSARPAHGDFRHGSKSKRGRSR
jgi:hypothetical protein